ncbi:MAG: 30S ribosomal protein S5 [Elusimicrobia bacterium]|nr:30S ribosomal protein S5 [Elusimicrobiota bacterium]
METQPPEELGVSADVVDDDKEEAVVATQSAVLPGGVFKETVVAINRVAKVVSGGKRLAFSAVAVVGDGNGQVGVGKGKARDVQNSILKAVNQAKKHLVRVPLKNSTIPVAIVGTFGAARVLLRPAAPGTGVIAGGPVRAVVEACGIKDILTKSLGTSNIHNVLYATISALTNLRTKEEVARKRGKKPEDI